VAPHVLVIGGGFGGLSTTQALKGAPVDITVVDRTNHHLFQPLLYQVATASLAPSDIAEPIRSILKHQPNVHVRLAEVLEISLADKTAKVRDDDGSIDVLKWDKLVLAAGATNHWFGHDDWAKHAPGLKTIADALELRRRILVAFERAEWAETAEQRAHYTTFVVIGGGPTGVELAGAIAEIAFWTLRKDFRNLDLSKARVVLLEGGPSLLSTYPPDLQEKGRLQLERLGVQVRLGARVTNVDAHGVHVGDELVSSATVLWGAGVHGEPVASTLGVPLDRGGRVIVEADCSVPGHRDAFVVGDLAAHSHGPAPVPGVAPAALQMGQFAAATILGDLRGEARGVFTYWDKGSMATIGRSKAIAQAGPIKTSGLIAWAMWAFIHVFFLITFRNRFLVMTKWAVGWVTFERASRLIWRPTAVLQEVSGGVTTPPPGT
jgi:NADH:ubiquinone reductase (H+-translocating)